MDGEKIQVSVRRNKSANRAANATPFVGGAKRLAEGAEGETLSGEKLSGKTRIKHAAGGAADLALDFTGLGKAEKGAKMAYIAKQIGKSVEDSGKAELTREIRNRSLEKLKKDTSKNDRISFVRNQVNAQMRADKENRMTSDAEREVRAGEMKEEAQKEMEKELSKNMGRFKAKIASRALASAAYQIAAEMEEKANQGGGWAVLVFIFTLCLAAAIDVLDIFGELLVETIIGTVIIFIINNFLSLIIAFFWIFALGGGHPKWFWKRVIITVIGLFALESVPILELLPWTMIIVCWNWYDFQKEKQEARDELTDFKIKSRIAIDQVSAAE